MKKAKIYTRFGDAGMTSATHVKMRIKKSSSLIEFYGCLDELDVFFCYAAECMRGDVRFVDLRAKFIRIRSELLGLSSQLAKASSVKTELYEKISMLEYEIDGMDEKLPDLNEFLLLEGSEVSFRIHMARVFCRRAERAAFKLAEKNRRAKAVGTYLNRLSDWLFTAARFINIPLTN